jgi:glycerol-3-phosphate dehydrogenase (NAD(P)+)
MKTPNILILGAGNLGQTLGDYVQKQGNEVVFWDIDAAKVPHGRPLEETVPVADFIFLCMPSFAVPSVLSQATSSLKPATIVVAFAKGLDAATGRTMAELLPELLPKDQPFVIVGGPMLATEIAAGENAAAVFASQSEDAAKSVADIFRSDVFAVEVSRDAVSVSFVGVLKNIYALGLGIVDGLELDGNAKGWIVSRALGEMLGIAEALDIDRSVILGTAGLADFVATGYSPYSRNRAVGHEIVKNGKCNLKGEGFISIPPLMARLGPRAAEFPLLNTIKKIAIDCEPAKSTVEILFAGT